MSVCYSNNIIAFLTPTLRLKPLYVNPLETSKFSIAVPVHVPVKTCYWCTVYSGTASDEKIMKNMPYRVLDSGFTMHTGMEIQRETRLACMLV
jgi:hypothetical protein